MDYGKLIYKQRGDATPKQFTLRLGSTTLGRDEGNDLVFAVEGVSQYHARIICTPTECIITDLGSTNGTFLNQVRLQPNTPHPLRSGDTLRIGPFAIRYLRVAQAESTQVEPSTTQPSSVGVSDQTQQQPAVGVLDKTQQQPTVLPPDIAAKLASTSNIAGRVVRRLPGNGGPPAFAPVGPRARDVSGYMQYLPPIYHQQDFLRRFLLIFEAILGPLDRTIGQIAYYFDPQLTPASFLPWLASWVDLVLNENWPVERRRALIRAAAELYRWRGTRRGLTEFIRIYTGVEPAIVEHGQARQFADQPALPAYTFYVRLELADPDTIDRALVEAIIEAEKPAHTNYVLDIRRSGNV